MPVIEVRFGSENPYLRGKAPPSTGYAVGLTHGIDRKQIMNGRGVYVDDFGAGDLNGFARLADRSGGCRSVR